MPETLGTVILVVLFGALAFYLTGRAWSPWLFAGHSHWSASVPALLVEVTVSVVAATWVGLLLVEVGKWSLWNFFFFTSAIAVVGWRLSRGQARPRYGRDDLLLFVFGAAISCWLFPPFEARFASGDGTGYLAAGIHVARTGSLEIEDPTVPQLEIDLRRILFPSVAADRGSPPYLRLEGGYVLRSLDSQQVLPAFHHGIAPWVALTVSLLGPDRAEWTFALFGVLGLTGVLAAARSLELPPILALGVTALAATQPGIFFYARFPMPEMAGAWFLWSGIALASAATTSQRLASVAGLALGCASLIRLENAFLVYAALVLSALVSGKGTIRRLLVPAFLLSAHALLHAYLWRTHYWGNLVNFFSREITAFRLAGACIAVALLVAYKHWSAKQGRAFLRVPALALLVTLGVALTVAAQFWLRAGVEWYLLRTWSGAALLPLGCVGLIVTAASRESTARTLASLFILLAAGMFLLGPQATPVELWVLRRAVPLLLPGLCLGIVCGVTDLCRPLSRNARNLYVAASILVVLSGSVTSLVSLAAHPYYNGGRNHLNIVAASLASDSVVLVQGSLAPLSFAPLVWGLNECPVYYVSNTQDWIVSKLVSLLAASGKTIYLLLPADVPPYNPPDSTGEWRPHARYSFPFASPFVERGGVARAWQVVDLSIYRWRTPSETRGVQDPAD